MCALKQFWFQRQKQIFYSAIKNMFVNYCKLTADKCMSLLKAFYTIMTKGSNELFSIKSIIKLTAYLNWNENISIFFVTILPGALKL